MWSYELGEKWRSSDGRFSVNAAGYFESWVGVQQVNALSSCGYVYTANVGDAHVYGGEIEATRDRRARSRGLGQRHLFARRRS